MKQKAFTLLEFLLVTVVIALMTVAVIAFLKNYTQSVMQKRTANDIDTILDHAVLYHLYNHVWPTNFDQLINDGFLTAIQQCSPWPAVTAPIAPCQSVGSHQHYRIETTNADDKRFKVSLTLDNASVLDALSARVVNSEVNGMTLYASVSSPEQIQKETGLFQKFGYTRDDSAKRDGNGKTIEFPECPSGIPVIFHVPYAFTGPRLKVTAIRTGVWSRMRTMALANSGGNTTAAPPRSAKLCMENLPGAAAVVGTMVPGRRARHRYFVTCLPKDVVDNANAPPYGELAYNRYQSDDISWCEDL